MISVVKEASEGGVAGVSFDQTIGKSDIYLDELGQNQEMEKWWPLVNMYGNNVGEVLVKVSSEECAILMARDYYPLSRATPSVFQQPDTTDCGHDSK